MKRHSRWRASPRGLLPQLETGHLDVRAAATRAFPRPGEAFAAAEYKATVQTGEGQGQELLAARPGCAADVDQMLADLFLPDTQYPGKLSGTQGLTGEKLDQGLTNGLHRSNYL